jgi:hypothetical protein
MKEGYVIYRDLDEGEIYVDSTQGDSGLVEITDNLPDAMSFATAREAYDWARMRRLDWWKVGAR